ncbi:hypothetical protein ABK040_011957 [Willaertia magna]
MDPENFTSSSSYTTGNNGIGNVNTSSSDQQQELTYEQIEPMFSFLPKMMNIIQEIPKSETGDTILLQMKELYDSFKTAQEFLNNLDGCDLTLEQQNEIYNDNLQKIKEKSELIEKYKKLEVFNQLDKLENINK